jgi:hypothetical protein
MHRSWKPARVVVSCVFGFCALVPIVALAEVERIEIARRSLIADGQSFGNSGPYEKIRGELFYAVDPENVANNPIVDLPLAPRGADGKVRFRGEFLLLKPVDLTRGNGRLLYDVNNRGNLYMLRHFNDAAGSNDPSSGSHMGNGFLMRQGYALLWTAWNWDVISGNDRLQIELPIATDHDKPIRQKIAAEMVNTFGRGPLQSMPLAWGNSRCYPALDAGDNSGASLTVRDAPRGHRTAIPNTRWRFARVVDNVVVPDPTHITIDGGFLPGKIYELIYKVQNPRVVGLGLAAVRDAISFFRFEGKDRFSNPNPLAIADEKGSHTSGIDYAYIFGVSQSGRFITHMLWQGFHVDEAGRMVFDGARIHVAGGGKGGFNHRFAQTTHHPSDLEGNYMPADHPPFNYLPNGSPADNDVLAKAKRLDLVPKIIITNNSLEYWTRSASLVHTDISGTTDAPFHPNVRYFMTNGVPHGGAWTRTPTVTEHQRNPLDVHHIQRALLVVLDAWVSSNIEPPDSRYPRIDRGQLITAAEHARRFPAIPGMRHPGRNLQPPEVSYGPRFWTEGIFTLVPPQMGAPRRTLVPGFDEDGNGVGGIRLPELEVPLGTYQGWNPRAAPYGAPDYLLRFDGSFWFFPVTEEERTMAGDPRSPLSARYRDKAEYVRAVAAAARRLEMDRLLLPEDCQAYADRAEALAWPPQPTIEFPHWKIGNSVRDEEDQVAVPAA